MKHRYEEHTQEISKIKCGRPLEIDKLMKIFISMNFNVRLRLLINAWRFKVYELEK